MQPFADRPKVALLVFWAGWGWGSFEVKAVKLPEGALCQGSQDLPRAWWHKLWHGAALNSCGFWMGFGVHPVSSVGAEGAWDYLWKTGRSVVHTHICLDIFLAQKHTSSEERSPFPNLSSSPSLYLFHFALFSCKYMPYIALMGLIIIFQCYGIITFSCDVRLQCHYIIKNHTTTLRTGMWLDQWSSTYYC